MKMISFTLPRRISMFRRISRKLGLLGAASALALAVLPLLANAHRSRAAAPARGTQILLLGTSGGPPLRKNRSEPSSLLIVDGRPYLIDCGIGTVRRLVEAGIRSEDIGTVFITHHHPDHDLGLVDVMANDFFELETANAPRTINIYGPPQTKELVAAAFHYISIPFSVFAAEPGGVPPAFRTGARAGNLKNPFIAHDIEGDGLFYYDDKLRVFAAENTHYALMPAESRARTKSFSYRFETPHGVIVFTGDTGPSEAVTRLAEGADVLVAQVSVRDPSERAALVKRMAEQNHWSPERAKTFMAHLTFELMDAQQVAEMATKAHVRSVVLNHYDPVDPAAYVATVKKYFSGAVLAGADLQKYCLSSGRREASARSLLAPCP